MSTETCFLICPMPACLPRPLKQSDDDWVIAVDGGLKQIIQAGLSPDLAVGDFDSLGFVPTECQTVCLPAAKDVTDTWAAAEIALQRGFERIVIFGGTGGRTEHTLANVQLLSHLAERGVKAFLIDGNRTFTARKDGELHITPQKDGFVSVFSLSDRCTEVSLSGLKYNLNDATLTNTFPLGVSNEFVGEKVTISAKGTFLVVAECPYDCFDRNL